MPRSFLPVLALLAGLMACAPAEAPAPQMTTLVGFDPARFEGTWQEVAAIGRPAGGSWRVTSGANGGLEVTSRDGRGTVRMTGPGRFSLSSVKEPIWVLWADADYRTVVLGTPSRSFALVLDRSPASSPDRLRAAREILGWNGYSAG